jgi:RNA polymerase sigma factor (sigma-70 family)
MEQNYLSYKEFKLIQVASKSIANRFPNRVNNIGELYYTGYMALLVARLNYRTDRGAQFKTYASTCIYNAMLKEINQPYCFVTLNESKSYDFDLWEEQESDRINHCRYEAIDPAMEQLEPESRDLICSYYGINRESRTLKQLGEEHGVSLQAIHKKIRKIEKRLHDSLLQQCA